MTTLIKYFSKEERMRRKFGYTYGPRIDGTILFGAVLILVLFGGFVLSVYFVEDTKKLAKNIFWPDINNIILSGL